MREPPAYYEALAAAAEREGRWLDAAKLWEDAATASIGHGRRARYREAADECRQKAAATA